MNDLNEKKQKPSFYRGSLRRKIVGVGLVFLLSGAQFACLKSFFLGLAEQEQRSLYQEMTSSAITPNRSFLKAKQWFTYRLEGESAKIILEDQAKGLIQGKGFLICRVPYGVDRVDVEFHEFDYFFTLKDKKVSIRFENIYSYSKDPNDITISYGPTNEREARITKRNCFQPLAEDLFGYIQ